MSALILWIQPLRDAVNWARAVEETETQLQLDQIHRDQIRGDAAGGGTELTRRQHRLRMQTQLAQQMQEAEQQERSAPRRQSVIDALSRGTFVLPPAPDPPVPEATSPIDPSVPEDCAICLLAIDAGAIIVTLRCEHTFHAECVTRWAARRATCPICRSRITTRVCALHGTDVEIGGETNQEFRRVEGEAASDDDDDAPEVLATLLCFVQCCWRLSLAVCIAGRCLAQHGGRTAHAAGDGGGGALGSEPSLRRWGRERQRRQ